MPLNIAAIGAVKRAVKLAVKVAAKSALQRAHGIHRERECEAESAPRTECNLLRRPGRVCRTLRIAHDTLSRIFPRRCKHPARALRVPRARRYKHRDMPGMPSLR
jgi:hypothetical protein